VGFFLNLTRFWTKLRVLVLCFPNFTDFSIEQIFIFSAAPRAQHFSDRLLLVQVIINMIIKGG
jgi:hypothetical protein